MKISVRQDYLMTALKALKNVSKLVNEPDKWGDLLGLSVRDEYLYVLSGQMAFIMIGIPLAAVQEVGECHVSMSKLHDLVKVSRDDVLDLSAQKTLAIESASGTRIRLALIYKSYPFEMVFSAIQSSVLEEVTLRTEELIDLCRAAKIFDPMGKFRFIEIAARNGVVVGATHQTEQGGVENFSFTGEHENSEFSVVVNPDWLAGILPYFGEHVTLRTITAYPKQVVLVDPDNPMIWGSIAQVTKN